jgi:hypothetical protein
MTDRRKRLSEPTSRQLQGDAVEQAGPRPGGPDTDTSRRDGLLDGAQRVEMFLP